MSINTIRTFYTEYQKTKEKKKIIQSMIAQSLGVRGDRSIVYEIDQRIEFIKDQLQASGLTHLVLGITGGIDTLTLGLLCQCAINELNEIEDIHRFIAVKYGDDNDLVRLSLDVIKPSIIESFDMSENLLQPLLQTALEPAFTASKRTPQQMHCVMSNISSRSRMVVQYALANTYGGLVIGTENAAKSATGSLTKFGNGGFDIAPLSGLIKADIVEIAKKFNAPPETYSQLPPIHLQHLDLDATLTYEQVDDYLLVKNVPNEIFEIITEAYLKTEHKRQLAPIL